MNTKLDRYTLHIPEEIMHEAVKMFACGSSRPTVVNYILSIDPRPEGLECINDLEEDEAKIKIGQKIRSADPKSGKFSKTLYGDLYVLHRETVRLEAAKIGLEFEGLFRETFLTNHFKFARLVEKLTELVTFAENTEPQNNSEYLNTCKTLISVIDAHSRNTKLAQEALFCLLGSDMVLTESEVDIYRSERDNDGQNPFHLPNTLTDESED